MSKISKYIQAVRDHLKNAEEERQRQRERETVADFAIELRKPIQTLLDQLKAAGIEKVQGDRISESDKQALLRYLQNLHRPPQEKRKRITVRPALSEAEKLWAAVAKDENGAAWEALDYFAEQVIWDQPTKSELQRLVNLIVAKSVLEGTLPNMKRGRPKSDDTEKVSREVAQTYWDMRDAGKSYAETVAWISEQIHKDERHVMRLVESQKKWVGETLEARERERKWQSLMRRIPINREGASSYFDELLPKFPEELQHPNFEFEDYIDHLEEMIRRGAKPESN